MNALEEANTVAGQNGRQANIESFVWGKPADYIRITVNHIKTDHNNDSNIVYYVQNCQWT